MVMPRFYLRTSRAFGAPACLCLSLAFAAGTAVAVPSVAAFASPGKARAARKGVLTRAARKGPAGVNAVFELVRQWGGERAPASLNDLLEGIAKDRRVTSVVRDWARYQATRLAEKSAILKPRQAARVYGELGYLTRAQVLGPFADASKNALERPMAPELDGESPAQGYVGKVRGTKLQWRDLSDIAVLSGAYLALDDILYPNTDALAYLRTWVRVPNLSKGQKALLHIGSGGEFRVWVNRALQGEGGADRRPHPLQDEIDIELAPGWNQILIKGNVHAGLWGYYLRLTDLEGTAIPGLEQRSTPPPSEATAAAGKLRLAVRGRGGLRRRLEDQAKRKRVDDLASLFAFYRHTDPFDQNDPALEELAAQIDEARPSAYSAYTWARVTRGQGPKGERLALALRRKNSAKDPESTAHTHARVHNQIALRKQSLGLLRAHERHIAQAKKLWPEHPGFSLLGVRHLQRKGWDLTALKQLQALATRFSESSMVQIELATALAEQGQYQAAFDRLNAVRKMYGPRSRATDVLVELRLDHGDQEQALDLRREASSQGARSMQLVQLARLEQASGHQRRAIELMDRALMVSPYQDEFHRERAEMLLRAGQKSAAIKSFERSLDLRPQQPHLRDLLAALGAENTEDFFSSEGLGLKGVSARIKDAKSSFPKADAVILNQKVMTSVLSNGLRETLDHRQIYIQDKRGVKSQENQVTVYDPAQSFVEVKRARVRHADGSVEELGNADTYSMTAAGYRMFYDQRQLVVHFPGLKAGDVIDVAFLRRDIADENYFGDYFGDLRPLRKEIAQLRNEVIYEAPASRPLYFNRSVKRREHKGRVRYQVLGPKVGPLMSQSNMPGWTQSLDFVHVSSYREWNDVADWYWGLVRDQLVSDAAMRKVVREILDRLGPDASVEDKVAALYHHVVQKTRYVGLEFGIHGYKPYRTTQVYERRFGDCKDKASLLKVLLGLAKIDSNLVLVRTRDQGRLTERPASLSAFNHAILYVPSLNRFLDGTAEFSGYGELPSADHGASVLVVKDGKGGDFRQIPQETPNDNRLEERYQVRLANDGSATAALKVQGRGNLLSAYRRAFEDPTTQSQNLQRQLSSRFSGVKVESLSPIAVDLNKSLKIEARLMLPRVVDRDDARTRSLPLMGKESQLALVRTGSSARRHPFARRSPIHLERRFEYQLPAGASWVEVPKSQRMDSEFGSFELQVRRQGEGVQVQMTLRLETGELSVRSFAAYRSFLQSIDRSLNQRLRFKVSR